MKKTILIILLLPLSSNANIIKGMFNLSVGQNFHAIQRGVAYRSGTMPPSTLARKIRRYGIKTVINLRGEQPRQRWWQKQNTVLSHLGIRFYNIPMSAKSLPTKENALALLDIFQTAPRPVLIHCQAGADRTSEAAAFWQFTQQRLPKEIARKQLSDTFGHFTDWYPAKHHFITLLPDDPTAVRSWLMHEYNPYDYPDHNKIPSPRTWPGTNFGVVEKGKLYRSAQLTPLELNKVIRRYGIKTIINLIGAAPDKEWWRFEHATAGRHGIRVHDIKLYVDAIPPRRALLRLLNLYDTAPQPILIHCRDGADRTGEAAALWKLHKQKASITHALEQLTLRHKHFAFMHPAKSYFIRQWRGSSWARDIYTPALLGRYLPPVGEAI